VIVVLFAALGRSVAIDVAISKELREEQTACMGQIQRDANYREHTTN
jgi:hypothetical protein